MKDNNNSNIRRSLLKMSVFGSIAGALIAVNPIKLFRNKNDKVQNSISKVSIHPLAVKRNKK